MRAVIDTVIPSDDSVYEERGGERRSNRGGGE
jgi:hypothetical protein